MIPTAADVLVTWNNLEDSRGWGFVEYINQCVELPELFMLGSNSTGEVFAVLKMWEGRIVDCDEFDSDAVEGHTWIKVL